MNDTSTWQGFGGLLCLMLNPALPSRIRRVACMVAGLERGGLLSVSEISAAVLDVHLGGTSGILKILNRMCLFACRWIGFCIML